MRHEADARKIDVDDVRYRFMYQHGKHENQDTKAQGNRSSVPQKARLAIYVSLTNVLQVEVQISVLETCINSNSLRTNRGLDQRLVL